MRIAHIITRMIIGGAQENTLLSCQESMRAYDDEVLLITGPALGPEGDLLGQGRGGGVPTVVVPSLRRAIHPWRDRVSYHALRRVLRDFRPDVVHTHSAKGGFLGRLAAASLRVPAIVHTVHGAPFHAYQPGAARWFFRACEKYAARRCHALVSVADAMTDLLVSAGVAPHQKFTTIYSGMETAPFLAANEHRETMRRELGYSPEHVVIGKVARLFHIKGHEYVIEAARRIAQVCPQVRFLLVGDGVLRARYERQISDAGLADLFHFTGLATPERIPALIGAMDILVHTSLREGLARALPQALLAGKPVVSFDIDGAREVVIPGQTGYLISPRDVPSLAASLAELAGDAGLRQRLGEAGQGRCATQFCYREMTWRLHELYDRLLEK